MSTSVLVVEDDLEMNELLGEYLALENIQYLQATTGQAGIHQASALHPDVVVLDLMLPDIDGFEVAKTLTSHRATHDMPIVILSCMCQQCDKEKGFAAGALFYLNKPFLPDDLISTLHKALEWKANLSTRMPAGTVVLGDREDGVIGAKGQSEAGGEGKATLFSKSVNQMVTDLFARTNLSDASVAQIREAAETLNTWAAGWNAEHARATGPAVNGSVLPNQPSHVRLDYRIVPHETNGTAGTAFSPGSLPPSTIEWKLSEDTPGMLADAFFKPAPASSSMGGALMGWGGLVSKPLAPVAPPAQWLQVLAKTGAARFEKDSKTQTVRFARLGGNGDLTTPSSGPVPVVEIDGMRYPTRLRDEALATKRK